MISAGVSKGVSWGREDGDVAWDSQVPILLGLESLPVNCIDTFWAEAG